MLLRRLAMALGVFVVLLAGVWVYQHLAGERYVDRDRTETRSQLPEPSAPTGGEVDIPFGTDFRVRRTDDYGRVTGIYEADRWRKLSANSVLLTHPRIRLNRSDGQRIYIQADSGTIYADEGGGSFHPRRGILDGSVRVVIDRWTHTDHPGRGRPPLETRPGDVVRIFTEDIEFDNEDLTLHTDGSVWLFSAEADLVGRGLTIRWHEDPGELRTFRLAQGEYMAIYADAEEVFSSRDREESNEEGSAESPAPASGKGPALAAQPPPVPRTPPTRPVTTAPIRVVPVPPAPEPPTPKPRNVYQAVLKDNVRVYSRDRSMRNADSLTLELHWDRSAQGLPGAAARPTHLHRPSRPARRWAVAPLIAQVSLPSFLLAQARGFEQEPAPAEGPASAPAALAARPEMEPIMIYWDGPLEISPIRRTENPDPDQYRIEAMGRRIVWTTPDMAALCTGFVLRQPEDDVRLSGNAESPVRLALANGDQILCREVHFEQGRSIDRALLTGPGVMLRPARAQENADSELAIVLAEAGILPEGDRISWTDTADAELIRRGGAGTDGDGDEERLLRSALFTGQVELMQVRTGDFVRCESLDVVMAETRGESGELDAYPGKVKAIGTVRARQEGSDIEADELTIEFADGPPPDEPPDSVDPPRFHPTSLDARGSVRLSEDGDRSITASAEALRADLRDRRAVLTGSAARPARIDQGEEWLEGAEIHLEESPDTIRVEGAGEMESLQAVEDAENSAPEKRRVRISWTRRMRFEDAQGKATVEGEVTLVSGEETISCEQMDIALADVKAPEEAKRETDLADPAKPRALATGAPDFGSRDIRRVECRKNVRILSTRQNEDGLLLRRMRLTGEELVYQPREQRVNVPGAGTMFAADYEKPDRAGSEWPTQTLFTWQKGMEYFPDESVKRVVLEGRVGMRYRSGKRIVQQDQLPIPALPPGNAGRQVNLDCDLLEAWLAGEDSDVQEGAADLSSSLAGELGELTRYKATGGVVLTDGPRRVIGHSLDHDLKTGILVVTGDGQAPAEIIDPGINDGRPLRSPRIECILKDGEITHFEAVDVTGGP